MKELNHEYAQVEICMLKKLLKIVKSQGLNFHPFCATFDRQKPIEEDRGVRVKVYPWEIQLAERCNCQELIRELEKEYNDNLQPIINYLQQRKTAMGERYPEAMFLPPVLSSDADREKMLSGKRVRAPRLAKYQAAARLHRNGHLK